MKKAVFVSVGFVTFVRSKISEEPIASINRVTRIVGARNNVACNYKPKHAAKYFFAECVGC
jgi:hypothetical protein